MDYPADDRIEELPNDRERTPATQVFGFFLAPKFSMLCFTSALEPMRSANRLAGCQLYDWRVVSKDGAAVTASNGIEVLPHTSIKEVDRLPNLFFVAGVDGHLYDDPAVIAWLRRIARKGWGRSPPGATPWPALDCSRIAARRSIGRTWLGSVKSFPTSRLRASCSRSTETA